MKIVKEDIIKANRQFGGNVRHDSSLEFALSIQSQKAIGEYKKVAHLLRGILIDHPFTDGNKRTATSILIKFAEDNNKRFNEDTLAKMVYKIAKNNVTSISTIERMVRHAIK